MFIYDEDKNKKIQGTPEPIDETSTSVKHTFKFDNDDFPNSAGPGRQIITCIELKKERVNHRVIQIHSSQNHNHIE
jgi:hypothetical protein